MLQLDSLVLEILNGGILEQYDFDTMDTDFGSKENAAPKPTFLLTVRSPEERIASAWLESPIEPPGFETHHSRK